MDDVDVEVAVVGGGITGLAAAWELRRRGVSFLLLERSPRLGGMIRTDTTDGFTIDAGPDSLLVHKPAALALCREAGLGARLVPTLAPRAAYVLRRGRLRPLGRAAVLGIPTRLGSLARGGPLSGPGRLRMALDLALPPREEAEDESVAAFFRRRFGREAVDYLAEPLLAGIHAGDVERLSVRALFPMLVEAEREGGSVMRGLRRRQEARARGGAGDQGPFRSLPGGLGELVAAVARRLSPAAVRCGCGVRSITGRGPFRLATDGGAVGARQVLLAAPAPAAAALLEPLDAELARLCRSIRHTSTATVALAYPRGAVGRTLPGSGFVVPWVERRAAGLSILAGTFVSSKWPGRAPEGHLLFRGFLGGARDPGVLAGSDADLVDAVHRDLARLLRIGGAPALARVHRWPDANPQHEVGHLGRVAALDARLARRPGLHLAGAAFRGVGIPDCIAAGRAAASTAAALAAGALRGSRREAAAAAAG